MTYRPNVLYTPNSDVGYPFFAETTDPLVANEVFIDTDAPVFDYPDHGHNSDTREEPFDRACINSNHTTIAQGQGYFAYFTARADRTNWTKLGILSGTTSSTGATLCKMALHSVDPTGDLTRIAVTANTTTILQAADASNGSVYETATLASYSLTKGSRYAIQFLQVGASAGSVKGIANAQAGFLMTPRIHSRTTTGQTDINASYTVAAATASNTASMFYMWCAA